MQIQSNHPMFTWAAPVNQTVSHATLETPEESGLQQADRRVGLLSQQQQRINALSRLHHLQAVDAWYQKMEGLLGQIGQMAERSMAADVTPLEQAGIQLAVHALQQELRKTAEEEPIDPTAAVVV
jgi:hypothetical protein